MIDDVSEFATTFFLLCFNLGILLDPARSVLTVVGKRYGLRQRVGQVCWSLTKSAAGPELDFGLRGGEPFLHSGGRGDAVERVMEKCFENHQLMPTLVPIDALTLQMGIDERALTPLTISWLIYRGDSPRS